MLVDCCFSAATVISTPKGRFSPLKKYRILLGQKSFVVRPVSREQRVEVNRLIKGGSFMAGRLGCMLRSRVWADPGLCAPDGGFRVVQVE
ncbi:hypothetical protein AKJ60_00140 [candidate division MSBL1 archaeon SCGC-AAA385M11]|nr:hypothetical protein AKJ60_00140 [candidate division MSBL1 archaeon SCGC-AAA385M11]